MPTLSIRVPAATGVRMCLCAYAYTPTASRTLMATLRVVSGPVLGLLDLPSYGSSHVAIREVFAASLNGLVASTAPLAIV